MKFRKAYDVILPLSVIYAPTFVYLLYGNYFCSILIRAVANFANWCKGFSVISYSNLTFFPLIATDNKSRAIIEDAMREFHSKTCIRFVQRRYPGLYDHVYIHHGDDDR